MLNVFLLNVMYVACWRFPNINEGYICGRLYRTCFVLNVLYTERLKYICNMFCNTQNKLAWYDLIHINRFRNTCWVYLTSLSIFCLSIYNSFLPSVSLFYSAYNFMYSNPSIWLSFYLSIWPFIYLPFFSLSAYTSIRL